MCIHIHYMYIYIYMHIYIYIYIYTYVCPLSRGLARPELLSDAPRGLHRGLWGIRTHLSSRLSFAPDQDSIHKNFSSVSQEFQFGFSSVQFDSHQFSFSSEASRLFECTRFDKNSLAQICLTTPSMVRTQSQSPCQFPDSESRKQKANISHYIIVAAGFLVLYAKWLQWQLCAPTWMFVDSCGV